MDIDKNPLVLYTRQFKLHSINFEKIWSFYTYLETFVDKFKKFISKSYTNTRDIFEKLPVFIHHDNYEIHKDLIEDTLRRLNDQESRWVTHTLTTVREKCIEADPRWNAYDYDFFSDLIDQFKNTKIYMDAMFNELQREDKRADGSDVLRLLADIIIKAENIEYLFNIYTKFSSQDVDFQEFQDNIQKIIDPPVPTYESVMNARHESDYYGGIGIKRHRSKHINYKYYKKTFNVYSKRKLKTFRKRRIIKKTKRNKHYTST